MPLMSCSDFKCCFTQFNFMFMQFIPYPKSSGLHRLSVCGTNLLNVVAMKDERTRNTWEVFLGDELKGRNIFLFESEHDAFIFMHSQSQYVYLTIVYEYNN